MGKNCPIVTNIAVLLGPDTVPTPNNITCILAELYPDHWVGEPLPTEGTRPTARTRMLFDCVLVSERPAKRSRADSTPHPVPTIVAPIMKVSSSLPVPPKRPENPEPMDVDGKYTTHSMGLHHSCLTDVEGDDSSDSADEANVPQKTKRTHGCATPKDADRATSKDAAPHPTVQPLAQPSAQRHSEAPEVQPSQNPPPPQTPQTPHPPPPKDSRMIDMTSKLSAPRTGRSWPNFHFTPSPRGSSASVTGATSLRSVLRRQPVVPFPGD